MQDTGWDWKPPSSTKKKNKQNTFYGDKQQLKRTYIFLYLALKGGSTGPVRSLK